MKKPIILILASLISLSTLADDKLYQVTTFDPHFISQFENNITTVRKDGRLWLVNIIKPLPYLLRGFFRPADLNKVDSYQPMVLKTKNENPFQSMVDEASKENIKFSVEKLSSYKTRYAGSSENQQATLWIENKFKELGYETKQICYKAGACSVLAEKKPEIVNNDVILVVAHFDSVGKLFAGADDNGSGTASLLEMARVLSNKKLKKTLRFLATNGEEINLLGAANYSSLLQSEGTIKKLKLVINMDMVGYNSNGIVELETNKEYETLANWFAQLAADYTTLKSKITLGAWGSDHVPFLEKGISTILTIEDWSTKTPCYHKECDKPDTVNYAYAREITKLNLAAVLTKDFE
ncbi:MAG: M28 family metallopeptidase [Bacteriovoracaceae bacterium]